MSKQYDIITIQQYLEGKLNAKESYQLERDALQDPLLQDAIDGFENSNSFSYTEFSALHQRLAARVAKDREKRNYLYFGQQRLAVASVAGVLFILACTLFWMINYPFKQTPNSAKEVSMNTLSILSAGLKSGNLEPAIGWKEYNHYLTINHSEDLNIREIEVSFKIVDERPTSIIVSKHTNDNLSKEIIKLLENGPDWKGSQGIIVFK